ncbi:DUF4386 domain-containing protein [Exiguobacterium sp. B2(2022)]|uniref:DUF4386 domain-containing protein n=1 Tax=Exiguobacterium sp. B2(2022) TaxID=2992755 RepID=UPI00237B5E90|nr:DUF4386 domain-containing protein [Exiguobacterium sp. B2(2022)]MDE0562180.1 DUF4386 domain-containing protein [Exiguobacterium sp. B2(2022)]
MNHSSVRSQRRAALWSGIALVLMALVAFFAQGYVYQSLVIENEAMTTYENLVSHPTLFRFGIIGWGIIVLLDLIVAYGLYRFFKPFHTTLALLVGTLRFLYTLILAFAVLRLVEAERLLDTSTSARQVYETVTSFETIWSLGLIVFGLHLIAVGWIAMRTQFIPRTIGILLVVAGFSYTIVHALYQFPTLESMTTLLELTLMLPMFVGELAFAVWLIVKGRLLPTHDSTRQSSGDASPAS